MRESLRPQPLQTLQSNLGNRLEIIAFGCQDADPRHSALDDITLVLAGLPRRYKHCVVEIAMRGASADYEDWIAVRVSAARSELESACIEWIPKQVTRQGYAIVPKSFTASA